MRCPRRRVPSRTHRDRREVRNPRPHGGPHYRHSRDVRERSVVTIIDDPMSPAWPRERQARLKGARGPQCGREGDGWPRSPAETTIVGSWQPVSAQAERDRFGRTVREAQNKADHHRPARRARTQDEAPALGHTVRCRPDADMPPRLRPRSAGQTREHLLQVADQWP